MTTPQRMQVEGIEIPVNPSATVKAYNVKLVPPTLNDLTADGDRLIEALNEQYGLNCDTIDIAVLQNISPLLRNLDWECQTIVHDSEVIHISPIGTRLIGL